MVGSIEMGKLADLVLWEPSSSGSRPHMVLKGGQIAYAQVGDANASIPTRSRSCPGRCRVHGLRTPPSPRTSSTRRPSTTSPPNQDEDAKPKKADGQ